MFTKVSKFHISQGIIWHLQLELSVMMTEIGYDFIANLKSRVIFKFLYSMNWF